MLGTKLYAYAPLRVIDQTGLSEHFMLALGGAGVTEEVQLSAAGSCALAANQGKADPLVGHSRGSGIGNPIPSYRSCRQRSSGSSSQWSARTADAANARPVATLILNTENFHFTHHKPQY